MKRWRSIHSAIVFAFFFVLTPFFLFEWDGDGRIEPTPIPQTAEHKKLLADLYEVRFAIEEDAPVARDLLLPKYTNYTVEEAMPLAAQFGDFTEVDTYDDFYRFENATQTVDVYRYVRLMEYRVHPTPSTTEAQIPWTHARELAATFLTKTLGLARDTFVHDTVLQRANDFVVHFYREVHGLPDYGFPTLVSVTASGDIAEVAHYAFDYETIDRIKIVSMASAYAALPIEAEHQVALNSCTLVYRYADSILQPSYLFTGNVIETGAPFTHYENAAVFE